MVFISFPNSLTSEEENLLSRYKKFSKKQKSLEKVTKPEPEVVATTNNKPVEAKDAKKVIEKLKRSGQLPMIQTNKKSEFKRKLPTNPTAGANKNPKVKAKEARELVSYDDDLFS